MASAKPLKVSAIGLAPCGSLKTNGEEPDQLPSSNTSAPEKTQFHNCGTGFSSLFNQRSVNRLKCSKRGPRGNLSELADSKLEQPDNNSEQVRSTRHGAGAQAG